MYFEFRTAVCLRRRKLRPWSHVLAKKKVRNLVALFASILSITKLIFGAVLCYWE